MGIHVDSHLALPKVEKALNELEKICNKITTELAQLMKRKIDINIL